MINDLKKKKKQNRREIGRRAEIVFFNFSLFFHFFFLSALFLTTATEHSIRVYTSEMIFIFNRIIYECIYILFFLEIFHLITPFSETLIRLA